MCPQESDGKEEKARMEFLVYFLIIMLMFAVMAITFLITRNLTCG